MEKSENGWNIIMKRDFLNAVTIFVSIEGKNPRSLGSTCWHLGVRCHDASNFQMVQLKPKCVCVCVRALALAKRERQCGKMLRIVQSRFLNLFGMSKIFFKYVYPQEPICSLESILLSLKLNDLDEGYKGFSL